MLMIRLQRVGRKHDPTFRVVVTEKARGPRSGRSIEVLGFYDARSGKRSLKPERISYWLGEGAKLSATVHNFLVDAKLIDAKKINALPKTRPSSVAEAPEGTVVTGTHTVTETQQEESVENIEPSKV